ncbi:MAG: hypothetical protein NC253_05260 [Ruminococcus sp.]|nr:hypothetical protein [Ruminococcus sp.]MCM1380325.1 hypothetical protein [Muribaculaceae bacterium]MCM1478237.1 hypothetical protein [Muribaculaceae bacterium]
MLITEEQIKNNYPLKAVKFMHTFDKYLLNETDDYGIKKCAPNAFEAFKEVNDKEPDRLMSEYRRSVKEIHAYLDKGFEL